MPHHPLFKTSKFIFYGFLTKKGVFMSKIQPIKNIALTGIKPILEKTTTNPIKTAPYELGTAAIGATGIIVSTFLQDFNKTVEEDNYFQLKINPETNKPFSPDIFQTASGMNLLAGNDVLVTAPTGTGKTAIAQYVITKNLNNGDRTFYTTPLKALSNEKFLDFSNTYGKENVGLITGDTKINPEAPIIIMTTEVYRNMAATGQFNFDQNNKKGIPNGVRTVIFDELQYLGDIDRGGIWEQSIIFTPKNIQILSLSATIENNEEINDWIASTKGRKGISETPQGVYLPPRSNTKETVLINVPSENRHVPLNFEIEHAAAEIKTPRGGTKAEKQKAKQESARISQTIYAKPRDDAFKALTKKLNQEGKLPAIYFIFSKKECKHLLKYLSTEAEILTSENEQKEIQAIIDRYKAENIYLGESLNYDALRKGYAIHNAGLLPSQKTLVEELFQKKLVKVVLATETLSAGINMPAKTTVISSPRKPASTSDGGDDGKRSLTANEFHQMAGRAGRRGIDTVGYCYPISCNAAQRKFYEDLMQSPSNRLDSNLNLDFSFIANYLSEFRDEKELQHVLLDKSLYTFNHPEKTNDLLNQFKVKKELLVSEEFLDEDYRLTTKGALLKLINGYEQLPIINLITNKTLEGLSARQIAGIIGGLANIEYSTKGEYPQKPFEMKNMSDETFTETAQVVLDELKNYEIKSNALHPEQQMDLSPRAMQHLYHWARVNETNDNGRINWNNLYSGELKFSIKDEGSMFKEITMTADLIKQLIEITEVGEKLTNDNYYTELEKTLRETLRLIQREPVPQE